MSAITEYLNQAELALAAYSTLSSNMTETEDTETGRKQGTDHNFQDAISP
jgi:hypothetical protein